MLPEFEQIEAPQAGERGFTVVVLLLMTGAFMNIFIEPGSSLDQANGVVEMQIVWSVIYLITFVLLLRYCKGFMKTFLREPFLVLLLGLAVFSTYWSTAPSVTFRRSMALVATSFFGLYFATRYGMRDQIKLLSKVCWIVVLGSLVFGFLRLGHSVDNLPGAWYGVFVQKNTLGGTMVFTALVFLLAARIMKEQRIFAYIGAFLSILLIFLSRSQGALVTFLLVMCCYALSRYFRLRHWRDFLVLGLSGVAGGLGVYWAFCHLEVVAHALNRDVSMSGRLSIWILSAVMFLRQPWLGYGYSAFWLGAAGPSARIWKALNWAAPGAHNGLLQIMLDLGLVGATAFIIGYLVYLSRAYRTFRRVSAPEMAWPLLFLLFLALWNLTESALMSGNGIFWTLYAATAVSVSAAVRNASAEEVSLASSPQ